MNLTKLQWIRYVLAAALLVVVILWTLVAEAVLVLQDISTLVSTPTAESQDGSTLELEGLGGVSTCAALYDEFRTQASRQGLAAIPIVLLAALTSVLVAVVPTGQQPANGSLAAVLAAQPRVPLAALTALLWACAHHHVSVLGEARELAAAAVDALAAEPAPKDEALRRKCLALRSVWERERGEATSTLARRMNGYGVPGTSDEPDLGLEATIGARVRVREVGRRARVVAEARDAPPSQKQESLGVLIEDHADVTSSMQMVELAVGAAVRERASTEDVMRWRDELDDAKTAAENAHRKGMLVLEAQPVVPPPNEIDVAAVPGIADELADAVAKVDQVSHEVEDFLRRGDAEGAR